MAHTRSRRRGPYRRLRREAPSTVAVLAQPGDFAAMSSRYRSFAFDDHEEYLRQTEALLRSLARQGVHTRVACFDAAGYARYCARKRLDPDSAASRTRYTAEVAAAGFTVPYEGESIGQLVALLLAHGSGPGFRRAAAALARLFEALGPGVHHVVCSVSAPGAPLDAPRNAPRKEPRNAPLSAALRAERDEDGGLRLRDPEPLLMCGVLAAGLASGSPGGLVVRTESPPGSAPGGRPGGGEVVRGWRLRGGWLRPLTEAEVFSAYCTDAETGEPLPPEPGVRYAAGITLPAPS